MKLYEINDFLELSATQLVRANKDENTEEFNYITESVIDIIIQSRLDLLKQRQKLLNNNNL